MVSASYDSLADSTYQTHFSEANRQQPNDPDDHVMDDFMEGENVEDTEVLDETVGGKRRHVQKVVTRGIVEAAQIEATSHQIPGNGTSASVPILPIQYFL